ncbi:MAG TPA: DUF397 domain-containing protein [Micromonosporaceae bacterium]|nr:DUF397 domain-containing protein [Micromonosporaceae bacterium]
MISDCAPTSSTTDWVKSSRSQEATACVEVALGRPRVRMRDSKDRTGPVLGFRRMAWREFVASVKDGRFDG